MGRGGLTYFFANARVTATSRLELQGLYNRGRSIDTRGIVEAQLSGQTVATSSLEGLLYESAGGRAYLEVARGVRLQAGYSRDKTNRDDTASGRVNVGVSISNLAGSGFDVTATDSRMNRPSGRYDSLYVSVGRSAGRRVYLSGDYSSSLSVIRATGQIDPIQVDLRPRLNRFSGSAVITVGRTTTLLVQAERTADQATSQVRVMAGISYRFRR
jgi:hemolysin activation/secretion protein